MTKVGLELLRFESSRTNAKIRLFFGKATHHPKMFLFFAAKSKSIKMNNVDYFEDQELEVIDFAPVTSEEAHYRIQEAEKGIANGEVVLHAEVMRHSYELLEKYGC